MLRSLGWGDVAQITRPRLDAEGPTLLVDDFKRLVTTGPQWDESLKPVAIVDGEVIPVKNLGAPVTGRFAHVFGVNSKSFPKVVEFLQVEELYFGAMRVEDLTPLSEMPWLTRLGIDWNTKATDLTPLATLKQLEVLVLWDVPKAHDLEPLSSLQSLRALEFAGGIWSPNTALTLEPLARLAALEELNLFNLRVLQDGLRPLAGCAKLRNLNVSNQFATEDYAFLSVRMTHTHCKMFAPYVELHTDSAGKDRMVTGSRKPFLNSTADAARLEKYARDFRSMQEQFRV